MSSLIILLVFARVAIFAAAFKIPALARAHFYLEVLLCALTVFMPRKGFEDGVYMTQSYFQTTIIIFCLFYNSFWRGLISCGLINITVFVVQRVIYKPTNTESILLFLALLFLQCLSIFLCHIFITKISFMVVDLEVSQHNNESLFDVLQEKVFVLDQESKEVLWQNKAAESTKSLQSEAPGLNTSSVSQGLLFNSNKWKYALVDPQLL